MSNGRRFELVRELGAGAFGTVYLAYVISTSDFRKKVAIKLLNMQWDQSGDAGRRLRDEARLLGLLRHRAIVQVDDLVMLDGRWAVVMEHISGADLERVLEALWKVGEPFPAAAALEVISAVAGALDAAYNGVAEGDTPLRVIHRDIKPSNVRVTPDGDVKVLDFGIARADFSGREAKTEQVRYGSLGYMAPERVLGDDDTPAGDIYALGCVLVELLRGKALGRSGLLPDQQEAQVEAIVVEVAPRLGPTGEPVLALLRSLLAYEPAARPTAAEVSERSRKIARNLGGEDLGEFARRFLPRVTMLLGDESKEAAGHFTEQGTPKDSSTLSLHVEGSAFAPTRPIPEAPRFDPGAADTIPLPPRRRGPVLALIGGFVVLALAGLLWTLWPTPTPTPVVAPPPSKASLVPSLAAKATAPTTAPAAPSTPAPVAPPPVVAPPEAAPAHAAHPATTHAATTTSAPKSTTEDVVKTTAPAATPASPDPGPTLRAVKFAAPDASKISAACGSVQNAGMTSALLRDVPAGSCAVTAEIAGQTYHTRVDVSTPSGFTCAVVEGAFACR